MYTAAMRRHAIVVACFALAASARCDSKPVARTCVVAPPQVDFRLTTVGTNFEDSLGRVVFLRGVDAGGRSKFAPYVPFDFAATDFDAALAQYMDRAASWGIDVMRVPFTWAALEPTQGQDDEAWLARYDALLDAAWARGIWTVVDFHQDVYAENLCGDGFPSWTLANPPAPHHDCPQWSLEYFGDDGGQGGVRRVLGERLDRADRVLRRVGRDDRTIQGQARRARLRADQRAVVRAPPTTTRSRPRPSATSTRASSRTRARSRRRRSCSSIRRASIGRLLDDVARASARRRRRLRAALLSAHRRARRGLARHAELASGGRRVERPRVGRRVRRAQRSSVDAPVHAGALRRVRRARAERHGVGVQRRRRISGTARPTASSTPTATSSPSRRP